MQAARNPSSQDAINAVFSTTEPLEVPWGSGCCHMRATTLDTDRIATRTTASEAVDFARE